MGPFLSLVAPHGVLELSVIAVSGAAGFTVGWALIDPGRRSRRAALSAATRRGTPGVKSDPGNVAGHATPFTVATSCTV